MRKFLLYIITFLILTNSQGNCSNCKLARITFYYPGEDSYGYATSTGTRLRPWKTCAVDPDYIPYFSTVHITELDLDVKAIDSGTDVIRRKASKQDGKTYSERHALVIDIPVRSKTEYLVWEKKPALYSEITWE